MTAHSIAPHGGALRRMAAAVVLGATLLNAACGGGDAPAAPPAPTAAPPPAEPAGPQQLTGILATSDLAPGRNRVSFLLTSPRALVKAPTAAVTAVNVQAPGAPAETAVAEFYLWPFGARGNYATELTFSEPGDWRLDVAVTEEDGTEGVAQIPLTVAAKPHTLGIGDAPPTGDNRTAADVASLAELTTRSTPDPDLYQLTVNDALADGKPFLVVFASPALCTSPTCGPQVETVEMLKDQYKGEANFIHVEVYDNPAEIQGDLARARFAPMVGEWGLSDKEGYLNESFVFIFDREGRVTAKYEGYASIDELTAGLEAVL